MTKEKDNLFQAFLLLKEKNEKPENKSMQINNEPDYEYFQWETLTKIDVLKKIYIDL